MAGPPVYAPALVTFLGIGAGVARGRCPGVRLHRLGTAGSARGVPSLVPRLEYLCPPGQRRACDEHHQQRHDQQLRQPRRRDLHPRRRHGRLTPGSGCGPPGDRAGIRFRSSDLRAATDPPDRGDRRCHAGRRPAVQRGAGRGGESRPWSRRSPRGSRDHRICPAYLYTRAEDAGTGGRRACPPGARRSAGWRADAATRTAGSRPGSSGPPGPAERQPAPKRPPTCRIRDRPRPHHPAPPPTAAKTHTSRGRSVRSCACPRSTAPRPRAHAPPARAPPGGTSRRRPHPQQPRPQRTPPSSGGTRSPRASSGGTALPRRPMRRRKGTRGTRRAIRTLGSGRWPEPAYPNRARRLSSATARSAATTMMRAWPGAPASGADTCGRDHTGTRAPRRTRRGPPDRLRSSRIRRLPRPRRKIVACHPRLALVRRDVVVEGDQAARLEMAQRIAVPGAHQVTRQGGTQRVKITRQQRRAVSARAKHEGRVCSWCVR